jgi:hypothetical protein
VHKKYAMRAHWEGTPTGDVMQEIKRLHESMGILSAEEQEATRQTIEGLVRGLRQAGVYGKYDADVGQFVEEKATKQPRRTR